MVSGGVINGWNMGELARGTSVGKAHQLNGEKSLEKFIELEMHDRDGRVILLCRCILVCRRWRGYAGTDCKRRGVTKHKRG